MASKQKTLVPFGFGSSVSSKVVVYGHCLYDLAPHYQRNMALTAAHFNNAGVILVVIVYC